MAQPANPWRASVNNRYPSPQLLALHAAPIHDENLICKAAYLARNEAASGRM